MLEDHAKLMTVFQCAGEIIGRKKLQKIIYIAKKLRLPFHERYQFHFYGPYSEELTLRIEELYNLGWVSEVKEKKGGYYQYRYKITEDGEKFLTHYKLDMPELNGLIQTMNEQNSRFLELVSTVLYFDDLSKEEVKEKVFTLKKKQNYSEEELEEAYRYIDTISKVLS
ncbi:YwgA family protein [Bacillus taeanensis]|uniref:YwgA family protein n=1 Tax=Bacillus taeanensis TaxID=273032 RepID=A0A366XNU6_9BACI|nr:YwgA family protein [Bacillus taeanensis]RBW67406.1 YwgA family protein [Bacillus taeanensis]